MKVSRQAFNDLLEIFFPKFCFGCNKEGSYICKDCFLFLSEAEQVCPACGYPSLKGVTHKKCKGPDGLSCVWDGEGLILKTIEEVGENEIFDAFDDILELAFGFTMTHPERFERLLKTINEGAEIIPFKKERKSDLPNYYLIGETLEERMSQKIRKISKNSSKRALLVGSRLSKSFLDEAKNLKSDFEEVWCFSLLK